MQNTWGLSCLPLPFTAEQREVPLAAYQGQGAPLRSVPPAPTGSWAPGSPSCHAPHVSRGSQLLGSRAHSCSTSPQL